MSGRHRQRLKRFAVLAAALVALVWIAIGLTQRNTTSAEPASGSADTSPENLEDGLVEPAEIANAVEEAPPPRRVELRPVESEPTRGKQAPMSQPRDSEDPVIADALENVAATETDLDLAMEGDLEAADRLARNINLGCRHSPRNTDALNRQIGNYQRSLARANTESSRRSYEASIHGTKVMFHACPKILEVVGDAREDIKRLAQAGDVMARYIYSLWPPDLATESSPLLTQTEWELLAKDFTFGNIESGEPLGLRALGLSYYSGTFTPQNSALGMGLLMAATSCGLAHPPTEQFLQRLAETSVEQDDYYTSQIRDQLAMVLTVAEQAGMNCQLAVGGR